MTDNFVNQLAQSATTAKPETDARAGDPRGARNSDRLRRRQRLITASGARGFVRARAQVLAQRRALCLILGWVGLPYRTRASLSIDVGGGRTWMTGGSMH